MLEAYTNYTTSSDEQKENEILDKGYYSIAMQLNDTNSKPFKSLKHFMQVIHDCDKNKDSQAIILSLTKQIYEIVNKYGFYNNGFSFESTQDKNNGNLLFVIQGQANFSDEKNTTYLNSDYRYANEKLGSNFKYSFTPYLQLLNKKQQNKNKGISLYAEAVAFYSRSGNRLIIPAGSYATIYNLCKAFIQNKHDKSIQNQLFNFWSAVGKEYLTVAKNNFQVRNLSFHTGMKYAQTVPHVHARLNKA